MSTPPRNPPRFLPTLTEVVHPTDLVAALSTPVPVLEAPGQAVVQTTDAVSANPLTPETSALVSAIVAAQIQTLRATLRLELEIMVKQAVQEAMDSRPASY